MTNAAAVTDLHREVSIGLLKSTSAYAVRTPRGQKDPGHLGWDPKTNSPEESKKTIFALERGNDNLGVHLHGYVVDVDVDTDNPVMTQALDYFLPATAHVWGRKSRLRTHRLYELVGSKDPFDPSLYPFLKVIQKHDAIKVEVRGGNVKSGQYSLLPGSLHPSGEAYEWHDLKAARSTPAAADLSRIMNGVRFACVASLIVPYWTEGQRNQLCMALSGFLYRAASHVSDMGAVPELFFDKEQAEGLLRGVMYLADDDEADEQMRIRTFEDTWSKAESGVPVQGATTLMKLCDNPDLVSILYTLLTDSPDLIEFDTFLDRYAVRNGTSNVIDRHRAGHRNAAFLMTVNDFRNSNMHKCLTTSNGERRQMTNILLSSPRAIRVEGLCFVPNENDIVERDDGKYINQWRGFAIEPYAGEVTDADVEVFLKYIDIVVSNKDVRLGEWVLNWVADIFKNPADKCGTALVLVGKPGAGKSILGAQFIRRIIGRNHTMQTNNIESLTGTFNMDSSNMLFIQCDEAMNSRRQADANRLKSMITDKTRRIEPKGVNAYEVEDNSRYMLTANLVNEAVAITDGQDDRRYTVYHVNEDYADNSRMDPAKRRAFWKEIYEWSEVDENLAKLHRWLIQRDYDRFSIRTPVDTQARRNIQQHSQRGFDDWLMQIVSYEHPLENLLERDQKTEESYIVVRGLMTPTLSQWPDYVSYRRLEDSYEYYRKRKGMSGTTASYNAQQIKQEFQTRRLLPESAVKRVDHRHEYWQHGESKSEMKRIRVTTMPKREDIKAWLEDKFGFTVEDSEEAEVSEVEKPDVRY